MPVALPRAAARRPVLGGVAAGLLVALAGCGSDDAKPTAPVGGRGYFVEAREGEPFRHLVVEGTPYEMGVHEGRLFAKDLHERSYLYLAPEIARALETFAPEFARLLPSSLADELRGMSAGSEVAFDDLVRREVADVVVRWHLTWSRSPRAAFASAPGTSPTVGVAFDADRERGADDGRPPVELPGQSSPSFVELVLVERRAAGGVATMVLGAPGSLGGLAGISSRGVVIASCEDDSLPSERRSLKGIPFAAGVRFAIETATDAQTAFDALPRLVGNRVLIADAKNRRLDALVGLSVVGFVNTEPNAWVLRPAGEGEEREKNEKAQQERLGGYATRPTAADAIDLAVAGRNVQSTFPVLLLRADGIEVRDAAGKTWTYGWTR